MDMFYFLHDAYITFGFTLKTELGTRNFLELSNKHALKWLTLFQNYLSLLKVLIIGLFM